MTDYVETWMTDYVETGKRPGKKNKSLPKKDTTMAQRNNSGAIFANDRKTQDNHPDGRGSCMIDGKEYWISSWNKTANGKVFRSLSFEPKVATPQGAQSQATPGDDLPF